MRLRASTFQRTAYLSSAVPSLMCHGRMTSPGHISEGSTLLRYAVRWNVLARSRIALLDRRFAAQVASFPEVNAAVVDRVNERALRLAVTQAISQLNRVDRRLLALFWHLAERWGRMTPEGVALPMTLSHRMLGQLVGARRPTVSTALSQLVSEGEIRRRDDGTWLLTGSPVGLPAPEVERVVPMRRRLLPAEPAAPPARVVPLAAPEPVSTTHVELRTVLAALLERTEANIAQMHAAVDRTVSLAEESDRLRARCLATRAHMRGDGA